MLGLSFDPTGEGGWAVLFLPLCGLWQLGFWVRILPVYKHEASVLGSSWMVLQPTMGFWGPLTWSRQEAWPPIPVLSPTDCVILGELFHVFG